MNWEVSAPKLVWSSEVWSCRVAYQETLRVGWCPSQQSPKGLPPKGQSQAEIQVWSFQVEEVQVCLASFLLNWLWRCQNSPENNKDLVTFYRLLVNVEGRIMGPFPPSTKNVHILMPITYEYIMLHGRKDYAAVIHEGPWGARYIRLSRWTPGNHKASSYKMEAGRLDKMCGWKQVGEVQSTGQGMKFPFRSLERLGTDSLLGPPEGRKTCRPIWNLWPWDKNLCCFQPNLA